MANIKRISTKEKIINEALTLFALKGYDAVSVVQIADAVGIKAPSLYKHYTSKQAIFEAILAYMHQRYEMQAQAMQMNGMDAHMDAKTFANVSEDQLIRMGQQLFSFFLHDAYAARFRRMLTVEQYHSTELAALYSKQYLDDPLTYQSMVFELLAYAGVLQNKQPRIMALQFYAPIYMLLTLCDRQSARESEALDMLNAHIRQFAEIFHLK